MLTKKVIVMLTIGTATVLGVSLGCGLGVGLTRKGDSDSSASSSSSTSDSSKSSIWQPDVGATWQIELQHTLKDTSVDVDVYDIDMFENDKSMIDKLHNDGRKVICYFSAGSYEDNRPDASKFKDSDLGNVLDGWPHEKWIDLNSDNVRKIMSARLDIAKEKGCDGVDPDNVDGYDNDNGLGLEPEDSANYVNWLAKEAHDRGMSVGLKNARDIIPKVIDKMQWCVNEQCAYYDECNYYAAFTKADKPVFQIEYPKGEEESNNNPVDSETLKKYCDNEDAADFSTLIKNINLDDWYQLCDKDKN